MPDPSPLTATQHPPDRTERFWCAGVGVSAAVHMILIAAVAGLLGVLGPLAPGRPGVLDTRWSASEEEPAEAFEDLASVGMPELSAVGMPEMSVVEVALEQRPHEVDPLLPERPRLLDAGKRDFTQGDLLEEVGALPITGAAGGSGTGQGGGDGAGGGGFFGIDADGKRVVYVVDRSGSMNRPDSGPGKTRFGRLKLEMVASVGGLAADRQFFIIFFNQLPLAMPATGWQSADPAVVTPYLRWMAEVKAQGDTDPRGALNLAFALQPDAIYFLTDGDFQPSIRRDLLKLKQDRIAIHTFAFGDRKGENVLKTLAENNGGSYTWVP